MPIKPYEPSALPLVSTMYPVVGDLSDSRFGTEPADSCCAPSRGFRLFSDGPSGVPMCAGSVPALPLPGNYLLVCSNFPDLCVHIAARLEYNTYPAIASHIFNFFRKSRISDEKPHAAPETGPGRHVS